MISNWTYTKAPDGVDLTVPLMPLRDPADMTIYGIDPLWLYEVLASWSVASGGTAYMFEMPSWPAATFANAIRANARQVKQRGRMYAAIPTAPFATLPAAMAFGDVPADVVPGDEVRRVDVSGMFDWMKDAKAIVPATTAPAYTLTYGEEHHIDADAERTEADILEELQTSLASGCLYDWNWFYNSFSENHRLHWYGGGGWIRYTAQPFTLNMTAPSMVPAIAGTAKAFAPVIYYYSTQTDSRTGSIYMPIGEGTVGTGGAVAIQVNPSAVVAAAKTALSVAEPGYKTDMQKESSTGQDDNPATWTHGAGQLYMSMGTPVLFVELAADYRHPQGTAT